MRGGLEGINSLQMEQQILYLREKASNITKYLNFNALDQEEAIWIPEVGKCICLTSINAAANLPVTIVLSDGGGEVFFAIRMTSLLPTASQSFPSLYRLPQDAALYVGTSDEGIECQPFGAANAVQVAYEGRSDFTNVANAAGMANGSVAALSSGLITQTRGRIVLSYNMLPAINSQNKIESVVIKYYCRLALTLAVGTSSMILYWRPSPSDNWIQLQQISLSIIGPWII